MILHFKVILPYFNLSDSNAKPALKLSFKIFILTYKYYILKLVNKVLNTNAL